jgi:uncharacterized RDD family membrane protein YckC
MMLCEQCATELPGATVICKSCGHNNALQKLENWRDKRDRYLESINAPIAAAAVASARASTHEQGNLIRFPKTPMTSRERTPGTIEQAPEWKEKLNARLRQIREQKAADVEPPSVQTTKPEPNRQPIVEAALRRINKANYLAIVPDDHEISKPINAVALTEASASIAGNGNSAFVLQPGPSLNRAPVTPRTPLVVDPTHVPEVNLYEESDLLETEPLIFEQDLAELDLFQDEEQYSHHESTILEAASLKSRIAAAVIDAEVIAFSFLPIIAVYAFLGGSASAVSLTGLLSLTAILTAVYFFVTYALAGRTIGMAILKLHLASLKPVAETADTTSTVSFTFQQAAARAVGGTLSLLLFPINIFCITRNFDRLGISDYLSGTQIVKIRN